MSQLLTIKEAVARSKDVGLPVSEYTLRRLLRTGAIPHRRIGSKYLLFWPNVERFLTCADSQTVPVVEESAGGIRRVCV